jgi:hypothetical protein
LSFIVFPATPCTDARLRHGARLGPGQLAAPPLWRIQSDLEKLCKAIASVAAFGAGRWSQKGGCQVAICLQNCPCNRLQEFERQATALSRSVSESRLTGFRGDE